MLFSVKSKVRRQSRSGAGAGGFEGVMKAIDDMVEVEGKEQKADDTEKPWCNGEFEKEEKEEHAEKREIGALAADIDEKTDEVDALKEAIESMSTEIEELDKAVSDATDQRKDDHEDYVEELRMSQVAVELVGKARNRLLKFYNPVLYKAPPKRERTMEEKYMDGGFFAEIRARRVAPPQAPETFGGEYQKSDKSSGIIGLMDNIIHELNKDIKEAEDDEKTAQKDYATLMASSQTRREELTKSIKAREASKADLSVKKEDETEKKTGDEKDVLLLEKHESDLHMTCDFILQNYDARYDARKVEVDQLKNAKSALAGAK